MGLIAAASADCDDGSGCNDSGVSLAAINADSDCERVLVCESDFSLDFTIDGVCLSSGTDALWSFGLGSMGMSKIRG